MHKSKLISAALILTSLTLTACNPVGTIKSGLDAPVHPIGNYDTKEEMVYSDAGKIAGVINEFATPGGICKVRLTDAYFDVTLDEENATPYEAGYSYGVAINMMYPEYTSILEPYLFENILAAFPTIEDDYTPVQIRMEGLFSSLDEHYREEIKGLADGLNLTKHGIRPDGILSVEELMVGQMVPDALRHTACSGLSLWGEKTDTHDMIAVRCLEWSLGSENSMCKVNTVLHIKNHEKSITSIGFLGLFDVISGVSDDGVMAAMIDQYTEQAFEYEGKTCYSFAIRKALEEYTTAKDVASYMVKNSGNFTISHNVMVTDGKESYCAEDICESARLAGKGFPLLRDSNTPIFRELSWDSPDSLCIVNATLTRGNFDAMSGVSNNVVRFEKYNKWVKETPSFTVKAVKDMMTQEIVETDLNGIPVVQNVHRDNLTQMIIIDYHSGSVQVAFTGPEGVVDKPLFYEVVKIPPISVKER